MAGVGSGVIQNCRLPGPGTVTLEVCENPVIQEFRKVRSQCQFFRFPVFQPPPRPELPKSWHRPIAPPSPRAACGIPPGVGTNYPTLWPSLSRSQPFPPLAWRCPQPATPSQTRRLRCQFSGISVARREQLIEPVRILGGKCTKL